MSGSGGDAGRVGLLDLPRLVGLRREADVRRRLFAAPDLTYLFWESTLRCNLRCSHCGSDCEARSPHRELETHEILAVIDTIAEDFDTSRIFVSITGGEPLVRKDLFEVVGHMTKVGLRSCIVTNGTLLDDRAAAKLVEAGMRTVTVSLDGLEPEHDAVRGKGTFVKALRGLSAAKSAGMTTVEAVTCVRPANLDGLPTLERTVRDAGADLWRLITIDRMGRGGAEDAKDLWLEPPDVRRVLDFVTARREAYAMDDGEDFDVRFSCGGFLGVSRERDVRPEGGQCYAGAAIASILCDGEVSACPSLPREWAKQGSVRDKRFSAIWRDGFRAYRDLALRKDGLCADCSWFDTCLGGGRHERLVQPDEHCWLDRQGG